MNEGIQRETELVLAPNEFAFYLDKTKGIVSVVVGSYKHSLSNTDQIVYWDSKRKRFLPVNNSMQVTQNFTVIPEGWYCHLKNPATKKDHPTKGISDLNDAGLEVGRKINIAGPSSFALWPGQMVKVVQGHHLRSNQYLVVRIYDVDSFRKELEKNTSKDIYDGLIIGEEESNLTTGQLFIVKGTKVHFYIPPNGAEVVKMTNTRDGGEDFVQNAVTLEQLQYCILQDENGNKEYVRGPDVVFPKPTQWFVENKSEKGIAAKKFRAIELNEISGLYIKVIKPYKEGEREYKEGEELFLTGNEQKIYFPRPEHAIISYDGKEQHHSVIIPEGEGRYVLDRMGGKIETVVGPKMFLPDPRQHVIVRRVLTDKQSKLYFPGNTEAAKFNTELRTLKRSKNRNHTQDRSLGYGASGDQPLQATTFSFASSMPTASMGSKSEDFSDVADGIGGDEIERKTQYNAPRTLTINSKYDGVVAINVWNGYAIMVVKKNGTRRVLQGPTTVLLDYDENLEPLTLSRGAPKSTVNLLETVYLRTKSNIISDVVECETSDMCRVAIKLSYRVNFEGDSNKWFDVENYVKFLCDHARSKLKNAIKQTSIREFYGNDIDTIRDIILGKNDGDGRTGLVFEENGMKVTDLEVKTVQLRDQTLANQLDQRARKALANALELEEAGAEVMKAEEILTLQGEENELKTVAEQNRIKLQDRLEADKLEQAINVVKREAEIQEHRHHRTLDGAKQRLEQTQHELEINKVRLAEQINRQMKEDELATNRLTSKLTIDISRLEAETEKAVKTSQAIDPHLTAAMTTIGNNQLVGELASAIGPLAMFDDEKDVVSLLRTKFGGLGLNHIIKQIKEE